MFGGPRAPAIGFLEDLMSNPKGKNRNRQGSSGRPSTKFMERPPAESGAGKDVGRFGEQDTTEAQSGEDLKGDNWKVASPKPRDPTQKTLQNKGQRGGPQLPSKQMSPRPPR